MHYGEKTTLFSERERVPIRAFFNTLIDELHQLYPTHVPEGQRYLFLQYLAVLDSKVQLFISMANYLQQAANRRQLGCVDSKYHTADYHPRAVMQSGA